MTRHILLLIACALLASGCVSSRQHAMKADTADLVEELRYRRAYTADSVVQRVPVQVKFAVPGFALETHVNELVQPGAAPVVVSDTASKTQLLYWRDAYGRLMVRCQQPPDTLWLRDTVRVAVPMETIVSEAPWYDSFGVGAGTGFLLCIALFLLARRYKPG